MSLRPETLKIVLNLIEERMKVHEKDIKLTNDKKAWEIKGQSGPHPNNWVKINGRRLPQKFVFSILFNINVMDFQQNNAHDFFDKIGLDTGKC